MQEDDDEPSQDSQNEGGGSDEGFTPVGDSKKRRRKKQSPGEVPSKRSAAGSPSPAPAAASSTGGVDDGLDSVLARPCRFPTDNRFPRDAPGPYLVFVDGADSASPDGGTNLSSNSTSF